MLTLCEMKECGLHCNHGDTGHLSPVNNEAPLFVSASLVYFMQHLHKTIHFLSSPLYSTVCVGQRQFHDQYFDTPQFELTLRDIWLRKRKGCWELKCPTASVKGTEGESGEQAKAAALCSRYKEITDLPDIQLKLKEVIKDDNEDMDIMPQEQQPMTESCQKQKQVAAPHGLETAEENCPHEDESWLSKMNLVCFAEFTTVRRSFTLEEEGVQIDLDQADFGYHVGEIEVLIPEGGDMQCALEKIERTAQKLGEIRAQLSGHSRHSMSCILIITFMWSSVMYFSLMFFFCSFLHRSDGRSAS